MTENPTAIDGTPPVEHDRESSGGTPETARAETLGDDDESRGRTRKEIAESDQEASGQESAGQESSPQETAQQETAQQEPGGQETAQQEPGGQETAQQEPDGQASNEAGQHDEKGQESDAGVETSFGEKIEGQLEKRGWTHDSVEDTINSPHRTQETADTRWNPDGTRNDDPATAYINEDESYVVRNDRTGDIVQVSDRTDPDWRSPFT
ncbi:colicin E5-related ribonuclease [Plantactinospora soyae]|uniref:DNA mismatch repair ATPase MutL n=1 Tax=Plantactinospora soyae TaxID=1544732 RepID=A0A927M9G2_9ACTN|nr:colicin E5-related ribonuclease [Plantactinospora soyae]MBE1490623.1 DNA mismatch repair ATPase MutL [Plantactinospora soyae]